MESSLELANVVLTGILALERGAKHCGLLNGVRHLNFSCSRCLELSLSRNASNAWSQTDLPIPRRGSVYDLAAPPHTAPASVEMEGRGEGLGKGEDKKNVDAGT